MVHFNMMVQRVLIPEFSVAFAALELSMLVYHFCMRVKASLINVLLIASIHRTLELPATEMDKLHMVAGLVQILFGELARASVVGAQVLFSGLFKVCVLRLGLERALALVLWPLNPKMITADVPVEPALVGILLIALGTGKLLCPVCRIHVPLKASSIIVRLVTLDALECTMYEVRALDMLPGLGQDSE